MPKEIKDFNLNEIKEISREELVEFVSYVNHLSLKNNKEEILNFLSGMNESTPEVCLISVLVGFKQNYLYEYRHYYKKVREILSKKYSEKRIDEILIGL